MEMSRSIGTILSDSFEHVREILRSEVRLGKIEIRDEAIKAGKAVGFGVGAGLFVAFGLNFLLWSLVQALLPEVAAWVAPLIVGLSVLLVAGVLGWISYRLFKSLQPKPERTIKTVKENLEWAKKQVR
jgi:hypothetical protein